MEIFLEMCICMGEYIHIQFLALSAERNEKQELTTAKSTPSTWILAFDIILQ